MYFNENKTFVEHTVNQNIMDRYFFYYYYSILVNLADHRTHHPQDLFDLIFSYPIRPSTATIAFYFCFLNNLWGSACRHTSHISPPSELLFMVTASLIFRLLLIYLVISYSIFPCFAPILLRYRSAIYLRIEDFSCSFPVKSINHT